MKIIRQSRGAKKISRWQITEIITEKHYFSKSRWPPNSHTSAPACTDVFAPKDWRHTSTATTMKGTNEGSLEAIGERDGDKIIEEKKSDMFIITKMILENIYLIMVIYQIHI
jgi:hypothetical protein